MSPRKEDPPFDVRLHWSPPNENGGKAVQQYLLEYKVLEEPWESAKAVKTNETNMMFIQPKDETYIYEIRISASNEFGFGTISEVIRVYFAGTVNDLIQTKLSMHTYFATFVNFTIFFFTIPLHESEGCRAGHFLALLAASISLQHNRRVFVYTFCLINICLSLSDHANKIKTLNIGRA